VTATVGDVKAHMARILKLSPERLDDARILTDLVTESFVLVEMVIELQQELGVRVVQDNLKDVHTVGDLVGLFAIKASLER
jgi:acyl carrier protein